MSESKARNRVKKIVSPTRHKAEKPKKEQVQNLKNTSLSNASISGEPALEQGAAPDSSGKEDSGQNRNIKSRASQDGIARNSYDLLSGTNALYLESLYQDYLKNPNAVTSDLRELFASEAQLEGNSLDHTVGQPSWKRPDWPALDTGELVHAFDGDWPESVEPLLREAELKPAGSGRKNGKLDTQISSSAGQQLPGEPIQATKDSVRALMLIRAYRVRGHLAADLDPLNLSDFGEQPELDPASYGFTEADMDRPIFTDGLLGVETASLAEILTLLKQAYCQKVGVQFMHISNPEEKSWIQKKIEGHDKKISFTREEQRKILRKLIEAEDFEKFLHKRFPGTKRFGLDGAEATIPALEYIIESGTKSLGVDEIILGMPHRGRLNVLASTMGKPYRVIFAEFQGFVNLSTSDYGSGDVKYHLGASSDRHFSDKSVHLSLTANPSHLEAVDPVVLGKARAKQTHLQLKEPEIARTRVLPLLLHGDAAFSGQGMVSECFGLSGLKGHRTDGTIHFIVNNQIGFTTSPRNSRSSPYPSDVALMVEAPILHVNGDDPEAVVHVAKFAIEYRQKFAKDVVLDLFCYRRFGHNEGDDPTFTQPLMYSQIRKHRSVCRLYADRLIAQGVLTEEEFKSMQAEFESFLESEFEAGKTYKGKPADWLDGEWSGLGLPKDDRRQGDTEIPHKDLLEVGRAITQIPQSVKVHRTIKRIYEKRRESIESGEGIDWTTAESLAFGSLLIEGFPVRLSGQDSARGTFSQRHSHIIDQQTEERYIPLNHIRTPSPGGEVRQSAYEVIDSMLSEEAVLGFEYGYSLTLPNTLVMWEAQFGDFANGAQVIIDQFLASGERKWLRMSGLVMLLPHGYEGQGPEHSSARLERYLQSCAEDNLQVANCSTPASYFHILRRQIHRNFRKPLILMTPKSLLRHKLCVSRLEEMAEGTSFHRVLRDDAENRKYAGEITLEPDVQIRRLVLCSGKIYYDLLAAREQEKRTDLYLLRLEQFYPYPERSVLSELKRFPKADIVWCQEEPENMGGWRFIEPYLEKTLRRVGAKSDRPLYIGRQATASTAAGTMNKHLKELKQIIEKVMKYKRG